jgi:hypothetical protein
MPRRTPEDIRTVFANSADFNQLFDAFEEALIQELREMELYRVLFWNNSLSPDELRMFGEKLSREFPELAYETYLWLANVFEVTYSAYDNFELAMIYYRKAAAVRSEHPAAPASDRLREGRAPDGQEQAGALFSAFPSVSAQRRRRSQRVLPPSGPSVRLWQRGKREWWGRKRGSAGGGHLGARRP